MRDAIAWMQGKLAHCVRCLEDAEVNMDLDERSNRRIWARLAGESRRHALYWAGELWLSGAH